MITGGARGLGRAMAIAAARSGANVAFTYLSSEEESKATIDELNALGVKALGILEPLVVRPNPDQAGHFLIVFGEQRWKAAKAAGLIDVPALIRTDLTEARDHREPSGREYGPNRHAPGR